MVYARECARACLSRDRMLYQNVLNHPKLDLRNIAYISHNNNYRQICSIPGAALVYEFTRLY